MISKADQELFISENSSSIKVGHMMQKENKNCTYLILHLVMLYMHRILIAI